MAGLIRRMVILLAVGWFLVGGPAAYAARLLEIRVERDGQLVLKAIHSDNPRMDAGVVWTYLRGKSLEPVAEIQADPADPLRATLAGKIRIAILHGDRPAGRQGHVQTDVAVQFLHLVRPSPDSNHWQLARGELERTAEAGGIRLPEPLWGPLLVAGGFVIIVLAALGAWLVWRRRPIVSRGSVSS